MLNSIQLKVIVIFLVFLNNINHLYARLASFDEAPAKLEIDNNEYIINADGSSEHICEEQLLIFSERGRQLYGTRNLVYNGDTSKIEIIEAKTINDSETIVIDDSKIEIKPLASSLQGFDQNYQILIAFPKVNIGSKLYLKYRWTEKNFPMPNNYWDKIEFKNIFSTNSNIIIKSKIPLNLSVNNPNNCLKIQESQNKDDHIIKIIQIKPIYVELANEPNSNQIDPKLIPSVKITSLKNFAEMAKFFSPHYQKKINQTIPKLFDYILDQAEKIDNEIDQINFVTSKINEYVRYYGGWQTLDGMVFPRDLAIIANTGYGDCKDYATLTCAILSKLGLRCYPSLVYREYNYVPDLNPYPIWGNNFNHAIVKVIDKSGKILWIDPTNSTSMAGRLYPDIAGRPVLVLDPNDPKLETIPEVDTKDTLIKTSKNIQINNDKMLIEGNVLFSGIAAEYLHALNLTSSPQNFQELVIELISNYETNFLTKKLYFDNNLNRIVKDLNFKFNYSICDKRVNTNLGKALNLGDDWTYLANIPSDAIGIIYMGVPTFSERVVLYKNLTAKNIENLNLTINSPWLKIERKCRQTKAGVELIKNIQILRRHVKADELDSPEFTKLKNDLTKYYNNSMILFDNK